MRMRRGERGLGRNSDKFIKIISPITATTTPQTCNMYVDEKEVAKSPQNLVVFGKQALLDVNW